MKTNENIKRLASLNGDNPYNKAFDKPEQKCDFCGMKIFDEKKHQEYCSQISFLKEKYGVKEFMRLYGGKLK